MAKILIVEDDLELAKALRAYISAQNYAVETTATGEDALQLIKSFSFDLLVLDWNLPGMSGDALCREYRKMGGQAPIIFLTGNEKVDFVEKGLDSGADDYMTKPFEIRELFARIRTLLKRRSGPLVSELKAGDLVLRPDAQLIIVGKQELRLRPKESALLEFLMRNQNKTFTSKEILDAVWESDSDGTTNAVRTWMVFLRQKLAEVGREDLIKTLPGAGYMIEVKD